MRIRAREGCLTRHLEEAIRLNEERRPRYAAMSGGASEAVSVRLIRRERMLLPLARWLDRRARPWQRIGIPLLCDEVVSMESVPPFANARGQSPRRSARAQRPSDVRAAVHRALRHDGFDGAARALRASLDRLADAPHDDCMTRHLLESALRAAELAPVHEAAARRLKTRSTAGVSRLFLRLHLLGLGEAARLDDLARPLQARGIGIICNDVPSIPPLRSSASALSEHHLRDLRGSIGRRALNR